MITAIALLIILITFYQIKFEEEAGWLFSLFMTFFITIAVVMILGLSLAFISDTNWGRVEIGRENMSNNIYSLKSEESFTGRFCLGSGYISSSKYYYMFERDNRQGLHLINLNAGNCYLFQDENRNPYISWQVVTYRLNRWVHVWPNTDFWHWKKDTTYDIHVPENTVFLEFKVN